MIKVFKNIEELSVYLFDKISRTGDIGYLIEGYNPSKMKAPAIIEEELFKIFEQIMFDYTVGTGSKDLEMKIKSKISIKILSTELRIAESVLSLYDISKNTDFLLILNKIKGFSFDINKDILNQVKVATNKYKSGYTKLIIKENNYRNRYDKEKKEQPPIYETAITISRALSLGYSLNIKKVSVAEWISYLNLCKKQSEDV